MDSKLNKFNNILLPKLSIGTKGEILNINTDLFEKIESSLRSNYKIILLQDKYYNDFYDNEISLFFLYYKIFSYLNMFHEEKVDNTEFLFVTDSEKFLSCKNEYNLYFKQEKHFLDEISGHPGKYSSKLFQNKNYLKFYNFMMLTDSQSFCKEIIKITDILPINNKSQEKSTYNKKNHYWENLFAFHAKDIRNFRKFIYDKNFPSHLLGSEKNLIDCSLFNNFYFLSQEYGTIEEDLEGFYNNLYNFLTDRQRKIRTLNSVDNDEKEELRNIVLVIHIKNKNYKDNYQKLLTKLSTDPDWNKITLYFKHVLVISPLWFKKELSKINFQNYNKINIDSCLIKLDSNNKNIFIFNNSNIKIVKILNLLNTLFDKIKTEDNKDYEIFHLYKKIREDIILNDFGLKDNLNHIKEIILLLARKLNEVDILENSLLGIQNIFEENIVEEKHDIFEWIEEQIAKYNYEYIYVNSSNNYVRKHQKEFFIESLKGQLNSLSNHIKIFDFNKNYPIATINSNKTLIINIGQDWGTNYFIGKLDTLFITDIIGLKKVVNIADKLNLNLIKNKDVDYLLSQLNDIREEIEEIFYSDNNKEFKNNFKLINENTKKVININGDKRIFFSIDKDISFGDNTLNEIYEMGFDQIYTFCLEYQMEELKEIWESLHKSIATKKAEIRNEIKQKIKDKLTYSKNKENGTQSVFYKKHSDAIKYQLNLKYLRKNLDISIIQKESATIDNLKNWVVSETLPQKRNVFEALLDYVGYEKDISVAWRSLKKEIASNQQEGRAKSQELNDLFKEGFSVENFEKNYESESDAFNILLSEIKNRDLNKTYRIEKIINEDNKYG